MDELTAGAAVNGGEEGDLPPAIGGSEHGKGFHREAAELPAAGSRITDGGHRANRGGGRRSDRERGQQDAGYKGAEGEATTHCAEYREVLE